MNRLTPYDLAVGEQIERRFPTIGEEARLAKKDATDPPQFMSLATVQRILNDFESPRVLTDHPEAAAEYLLLLYSAFRFWQGGKVVHRVAREDWDNDCTVTVAQEPARSTPGACYLQFTERWFWAQIGDSAPHEPLDGIFLAPSADGRQLTLVAVLGMRVDRGGFSQVSMTVAIEDLAAARHEAERPLFEPLMEGGREAGFRSIGSAADLLLLTQLALDQVSS